MTITKQDIQALTPERRIVWHLPPGQPMEMGLYVDVLGDLRTDAGHLVCFKDGSVPTYAVGRIARIVPPAFVPHVGMVIGHPDDVFQRLVCVGDDEWLGWALEIDRGSHWFADGDARDLIENHGWEVMGDLSAPGEVTDAEVEAFRAWLNPTFDLLDETIRSGLEAAREARND